MLHLAAPAQGEIQVRSLPRGPTEVPEVRRRMAERIVRLRGSCGYSQVEVAHKLGLSDAALSMWEKAKTEPNLEKLVKLAAILKTTPEYLAFGIIASEKEQ